ncbi:FtsX-like permease family protein [Spirosoma aureum]|uniref:FtsX-like permease family protein n=1 Tax=Spirosoma aureum TaxID=2692134 RepID=A0A6G9ARY8_9BACT|nr:ABC transporter permease [Spirosoma aureum]QIP15148.1 FtsX-like permease family protein [Spirosoma aureum]
MVQSYVKMAWRILRKQRLYSSLNIVGLAVGLATTLLLLLWINDELGYDRFHSNHGQIVKVMLNITSESQTQTYGWVATPVADAMQREIPGVKQTTCSWEQKAIFSYNEITSEEKGIVADSAFLRVFNFPLLQGNPATALLAPNSLVITRHLAEKYFGTDNPVGKIIRIDQTTDCKIVGVLADIPSNSTLQFDYLRPMPTPAGAGSWLEIKANVFAVIDSKTDPGKLQAQLKTMTQRHMPDWLTGWAYFSYKLDDLYLRSNFENGQYAGGGRITYVRLFGLVAIFVLLIAAINFMNLSTARATGRAKEVGVRKAVGAGKWSLIGQFLSESLLLTSLAGLVALGLILVGLPLFNGLLQKRISIDWTNPIYWMGYVGVLWGTSLLAGLYPAFVLSAFQPVRVLNGLRERSAVSVVWLRKALVVVQFTAASMLLVGTGVVYQQIDFIRNRSLGYQKQNLIRFDAKGLTEPEPYKHAKTMLSSVPGVAAISSSSSSFQGTFGRNYVEWRGQETPEKTMFVVINGDHDLLPTLKVPLQSGRGFSPQFSTDSVGVIINEAAVRRMKFRQPLKQMIRVNNKDYQVIGVAKDFHIASIHQPIEPTVILYDTKKFSYFFARLDDQNQANTLRQLAATYQSLRPGAPFSFQFVDQEYERVYQSELQIGTLANWFSVIAIFISCLGLFGLASFSVERRTKEIGVRKVLGASVTSVFVLLNREFIGLVLISLVLAVYPVWYIMNGWLDKFAYHVQIGGGVFVLVGLLSLAIALVTVSLQSIRAALKNPVKSLRTE